MAQVRLNKTMREALGRFALNNCTDAKAQKAADKAYAKALPLVLSCVEKKYPAADMEILAKYKSASKDNCLLGFTDSGQLINFDCRDGDGPTVPRGYCRSRNYAWTKKAGDAIESFNLAKDQAKEANQKIYLDYAALIANYKTADEVLEVWPAADLVLRGFIDASQRNLPATLSVEAVKRIRSINAGAQSKAA